MSIQRWVVYGDTDNMYSDPEGQVVRIEDHLAAYEDVKKRAYLHGLDRARDAVAALSTPDDLTRQEALAAIDALRTTR